MAEETTPSTAAAGGDAKAKTSSDEIALELMKFIAVTTGYGKGPTGAGFGKSGGKSSEEYADALLELFDRCRTAVAKPAK